MTNIAVAGIIGTDSLFQGNTDIVNVNLNNVSWQYDEMFGSFYECQNLKSVTNISNNVLYMVETFYNCQSMIDAPVLPNNVLDLEHAFGNCYNLVNAPVIPNTVQRMPLVFSSCESLVNAPVIPNSVIDLSSAFSGCYALGNISSIPNSVVNMAGTFSECHMLYNPPSIPNSVIDLSGTFLCCDGMYNTPDLTNATNVVNMCGTFDTCLSLVNAPVIPNSVEDMSWTFAACESLVNAPNMTNATNVVNMVETFYGCSSLTGDVRIGSEMVKNADGCFYLEELDEDENATGLDKNVYIPLEMTHQAILTKYCWERKGLIVYIDDDFYSQAYGQEGQIWYEGQVYDEYMNPFNGYLVWMPNYQSFVIYYSNAGQWGAYAIEYTPKGNISVTKNIGDTSFTYDTFTTLGYSTEERARDGVMLFDINYVPGSVDLTDYDYNMDANNNVLLTNYKGIGKTNIVTPHV